MKALKISFCILFLFASLFQTFAQVKLSFNPEKGTKYLYTYKTEQEMKQKVMEKDVSVDAETVIIYEMDIKDNNKDEVVLETTYKDIYMDILSPMSNMKYDSKNPQENPSEIDMTIAEMFDSFIGKSFQAHIASNGVVNSISGIDEMFDGIQKTISSSKGQVASQISASMKQSFSDEAMKATLEQSFKIYPDNEVNIGDSWSVKLSFSIASMVSEMENIYTLKSISGNIAFIDLVSSFSASPTVGMSGELGGTQKGTLEMDIKTGMPLKSNIVQDLKGNLSIQGYDIVMNVVSKVDLSTQVIK